MTVSEALSMIIMVESITVYAGLLLEVQLRIPQVAEPQAGRRTLCPAGSGKTQ